MDLKSLLYFVTVAEEQSFTRAAKKLYISQPSLSAMIKKLENNINLTLINREKNQIHLTAEGQIVYGEAKQLLGHYQSVAKEVKRLDEKGSRQISIGILESTHFWMTKVLRLLNNSEPDVQIDLTNILSQSDVTKALESFQIHFAITNQFIQQDNITMIPLYSERLIVLIPLDHTLQNNKSISLQDLRNEPIIMTKQGYQIREYILNSFAKSQITPIIKYEIDRFEIACNLVEERLGVTIVPENYISHKTQGNYLIKPFSDTALTRTIYLAYINNRYQASLIKEIIHLIITFNYLAV